MCVCVCEEFERFFSHVRSGKVYFRCQPRDHGTRCSIERTARKRKSVCRTSESSASKTVCDPREVSRIFFSLFFFVCYILKKIYPRAMRPKRLGSFFLNSRSAGSLSLVLTLNVTSYFFPFFFFFFSSLLIRMYNLYVYIFVYIYVRVYRERKRVKNEPRPSRAGNERTNAMQRREKGKVKIGDGRELLFFVFFPFPFFSFLFFRLKSRVFRDRTDFSFYLSAFFLYRLTV